MWTSCSRKKKLCEIKEKTEAIRFFRDARQSLQEIGRLLHLKVSTLAEWNALFDERLRPLAIPDRRGRSAKVTATLVRTVVQLAREYMADGRRLRIKAFARHLADHDIELSSKTVSEILIANDLHGVKVRKRRPRFYQQLRQSYAGSLVSVDGKEFIIMLGAETHRLNLELCVDVNSFAHSGYSIAESETAEEAIKVLEMHRQAWGSPLAVVTDHGSANLAGSTLDYLKRHDIEILPAGPANPKGNGTVEGAFSEMAEVIGTILLDTTRPRTLAKSILAKIVSVYITLRNRLPRLGEKLSPLAAMSVPVADELRTAEKDRLRHRAARKAANPEESDKLARLHWLIDYHRLAAEGSSLSRAEKCIVCYDRATIAAAEAAFLKAISRDDGRRTLPYFFGILRNLQKEADAANHKDYCRKRYHHQQLLEREQRQAQETVQVSPQLLVEMLRSAISQSIASVREIAMRQVERMAAQLKQRYRYLGVLKKTILEVLAGIDDVSIAQRQEMVVWAEQLSN
jgi:transposase InsO family protein